MVDFTLQSANRIQNDFKLWDDDGVVVVVNGRKAVVSGGFGRIE